MTKATAENFVDVVLDQDDEGIFDLVVDDAEGDFLLTGGMETAIIVTAFTDRRANPDEVENAVLRRGWIGDLFSDVPNDKIGSGLWLYEQSRLSDDVVASLELEMFVSLEWMIEERLVTYHAVTVTPDNVNRSASLLIKLQNSNGSVENFSYPIWLATVNKYYGRV